MELQDLKIKCFEIRRRIDLVDAQKEQLIQAYNNTLRRINEIESKTQGNDDSQKQAGENKVVQTGTPDNNKSN